MIFTQLEDPLHGRWIIRDTLNGLKESEKALFEKSIIAYQTGNGTHLVPVPVPVECTSGLEIH